MENILIGTVLIFYSKIFFLRFCCCFFLCIVWWPFLSNFNSVNIHTKLKFTCIKNCVSFFCSFFVFFFFFHFSGPVYVYVCVFVISALQFSVRIMALIVFCQIKKDLLLSTFKVPFFFICSSSFLPCYFAIPNNNNKNVYSVYFAFIFGFVIRHSHQLSIILAEI